MNPCTISPLHMFRRHRLLGELTSAILFGSLMAGPQPAQAGAVAQTVLKQFEYDAAGNVMSRTDANGATTFYTYDRANRLTSIIYPDGKSVVYQYDASGKRTRMEDWTGVTTYEYDGLERLTVVHFPGGKTVGYGYDRKNRRTLLTYADGSTVAYTYTTDDLLETVTDVTGTTTYGYDAGGRVTTRTLPNGILTTYGYDQDGRLTNLVHRSAGGQTLLGFGYTLDGVGNRTRVDKVTPGGAETTLYQYDRLYRLTRVEYHNGRTVEYAYDGAGNRTRMDEDRADGTRVITTYAYDMANQLTSTAIEIRDAGDSVIGADSETFEYDAAGRLIRRHTGTKEVLFQYDYEDRLVRWSDGPTTLEFAYNGDGVRVEKKVGTKIIRYTQDVGSRLPTVLSADLDGANPAAIKYVRGRELLAQQSGAASNYYLQDALGDVVAKTDSGVAVTKQYEYDAFGATTSPGNVADVDEYRFTGEQNEAETELIFLRARYYSPSSGRFLTKDPLGYRKKRPTTFNPYVYCGNNPITRRDPSGLLPAITGSTTLEVAPVSFKEFVDTGADLLTHPDGRPNFCGISDERDAAQDPEAALRSIEPYKDDVDYYQQQIGCINHDTTFGNSGVSWNDFDNPVAIDAHGKLAEDSPYIGMQILFSSMSSGGEISRMAEEFRFSAYGSRGDDYVGYSYGYQYGSDDYMYSYSEPDLGGVYLNKAATYLGDLSEISGVAYDPVTGQLVLHGKRDVALPGMNPEDLAVAVRAVYELNEDPGITIGTTDSGVEGMAFAEYFGGIESTHFGQTLFEADRLLKGLMVGKDNLSGNVVSPGVGGYRSILDRLADTGAGGGSWRCRIWFEPRQVTLAQSADGKGMLFDEATLDVFSEFKRDGVVTGSPECEAFAANLEEQFDAYGRDAAFLSHDRWPSSWEKMREVMKIVATLKWIKANNIPLDTSWLEGQGLSGYETPTLTPWAFNSTTRGSSTYSMYGGIDFWLDEAENLDLVVRDGSVSTRSAAALGHRGHETTLGWEYDENGTNKTAVALSLAPSRKDGKANFTETDLEIPVPGGVPLELRRFWNSFDVRSGAFGHGWQMTPYEIRPPGPLKLYSLQGRQFYGYKDLNLVDRIRGTTETFLLTELDGTGQPIYEKEGSGGRVFLKEDGSFEYVPDANEGGRFGFDPDGRLTSATDRNSHAVTVSYLDGKATLFSHSSGASIQLNYGAGGRIASAKGSDGRGAVYSYDGAGNLGSVTAGGRTRAYRYDADHLLVGESDSAGDLWGEAHDVYGRVVDKQTSTGLGVATTYSLAERQTAVTDSEGASTTLSYDGEYRLAGVVNAEGNQTHMVYADTGHRRPTLVVDGLGKTNTFTYTDAGLPRTVRDGEGGVRDIWYNPDGTVWGSRTPEGRVIAFGYDGIGNVACVYHDVEIQTDADGEVTSYSYDPDNVTLLSRTGGLVTEQQQPESGSAHFAYDASGNVIRAEAGTGRGTSIAYDALGRPSAVSDDAGVSAQFAYDGANRVTTVTTPSGVTRYTYDRRGNTVAVADANGNTTHFEYDSHGNMVAVIDAEGGITRYAYDAYGKMVSATLPNRTATSYEYDRVGRLRAISTTSGSPGTPSPLAVDFSVAPGSAGPGGTVTVAGNVSYRGGGPVGSGTVIVTIGGEETQAEVLNGAFSVSVSMPPTGGQRVVDVRASAGQDTSEVTLGVVTVVDEDAASRAILLNCQATPNPVPVGQTLTVSGSASYLDGQTVASGSVQVTLGGQAVTAAIIDGAYSTPMTAPATGGQAVITAAATDGHGLAATATVPLTVLDGTEPRYTLSQFLLCSGVEGANLDPVGVRDKLALTTNEVHIVAWTEFHDIVGDHQVRWKLFKPDGTLFGSPVNANIHTRDFNRVYADFGILGIGYSPGRWTAKLFVDGRFVDERHMTVGFDLIEHGVGGPYKTTDSNAVAWAVVSNVVESFEAKFDFSSDIGLWLHYGEVQIVPATNNLYTIYGPMPIAGGQVVSFPGRCGAQLSFRQPAGVWALAYPRGAHPWYSDHFLVLEDPPIPPEVSVTAALVGGGANTAVQFTLTATDVGQQVSPSTTLHWTDGITDFTAGSSFTTPPLPPGTLIEYWAEATDRSGNRSTSAVEQIRVPTDVTTPEYGSGPRFALIGNEVSFTAGGSVSPWGQAVEYQFDWGDGGQYSEWCDGTALHAWSVPGEYAVRVRARSAPQNLNISDWSTPQVIRVAPQAEPLLSITDDSGNAADAIVAFASTVLGATNAPHFFHLFNAGEAALQMSNVRVAGPNTEDFIVQILDATSNAVVGSSFDIAPNQTFHVRVEFAPSASGARAAQIVLDTNDPRPGFGSVALSALGQGRPATTAYRLVIGDIAGGVTVRDLGTSSNLASAVLGAGAIAQVDAIDVDADGREDAVVTLLNVENAPTYCFNLDGLSEKWRTDRNNSFAEVGQDYLGAKTWAGDFDGDDELELLLPYYADGWGGKQYRKLNIFSARNGQMKSSISGEFGGPPTVYHDTADGRTKVLISNAHSLVSVWRHWITSHSLVSGSQTMQFYEQSIQGVIDQSAHDSKPRVWGYTDPLRNDHGFYVRDGEGFLLWNDANIEGFRNALYGGDLTGTGEDLLLIAGAAGGGAATLKAARMEDGGIAWSHSETNSYTDARVVAIEDLNGDDRSEVLFLVRRQSGWAIQLLSGQSGQLMWQAGHSNIMTVVDSVRLHDVNDDGVKDVLFAAGLGVTAHDGISGSVIASYQFATNVTAFAIAGLSNAPSSSQPRLTLLSSGGETNSFLVTCAPTRLGETSAEETMTLYNTGNGPLFVTAGGIEGANASEFRITYCDGDGIPEENQSLMISPGGTGSIRVRCQPTAKGVRSGALRLYSNSNNELKANFVTLLGAGVSTEHAFDLMWPFNPSTQETVLYSATGAHGGEGQMFSSEGFHGGIYYSVREDGSALPSKVRCLDPSSGSNTVIVGQPYYKFTAIRKLQDELFIANEEGHIWRFDGSNLVSLPNTPFGLTDHVTAMAEFKNRLFFGTSAGKVYCSSDGTTFTFVLDAKEDLDPDPGDPDKIWRGGGGVRDFGILNGRLVVLQERIYRYIFHTLAQDWSHYYVAQSPDGDHWSLMELYRAFGWEAEGVDATALQTLPDRLRLFLPGLSFQDGRAVDDWSGTFGPVGGSLLGHPIQMELAGRSYALRQAEGQVSMVPFLGGRVEKPQGVNRGYTSLVNLDGKLYAIGSQDPSNPDARTHVVSLLGNYLELGPELEITDDSGSACDQTIDFGAQQIATSSMDQRFTIRNVGNQDLEVREFHIEGTCAEDFQVSFASAGGTPALTNAFSVIPGQSVQIEVRFVPSAAGPRSAQLRFETNDPDDGESSPQLTMTGAGALSGPEITVSDTRGDENDQTLTFANTPVHSSSDIQSFAIANTGSHDLRISGFRKEGEGADEFSIIIRNPAGEEISESEFVVGPGDAYMLDVVFAPSAAGIRNATIHFDTNDPDGSERNVSLSLAGTGSPQGPEIRVTDDSGALSDLTLTFPPTFIGNTSATLKFMLHSEGDEHLSISDLKLGGAAPEEFLVTVHDDTGAEIIPSSSFSIPAGKTYTLGVTFTPRAEGNREALIEFLTRDPDDDEGSVVLTLKGSARHGTENFLLIAADMKGQIEVRGLNSGATLCTTSLYQEAVARLDLVNIDTTPAPEVIVTPFGRKSLYCLNMLPLKNIWSTGYNNVWLNEFGNEMFGARVWSGDFDRDGQAEILAPYYCGPGWGYIGDLFAAASGARVGDVDGIFGLPVVYIDPRDGHYKAVTMRCYEHPYYILNTDMTQGTIKWDTFDVPLDSPMSSWKLGAVGTSLVDGSPRIWGGGSNRTVCVFSGDGTNLWRRSYGGTCEAETVYGGNLRADGIETLLVGGKCDFGRAQLDAVKMSNGDVIWTFADTNAHWTAQVIGAEDANGDGKKDVFILTGGAQGFHGPKYQAISGADGHRLWEQEYSYGTWMLNSSGFADVNGDSTNELMVIVNNNIEARGLASGCLVRTFSFCTNVTTFAVAPMVAPAVVTKLSAVPASMTSIALHWRAAIGASGYVVRRGGLDIGTTSELEFVDAGLSSGTSYSYTVSATNHVGVSAESDEVDARTAVLETPQDLSCGIMSTTSVMVSWSEVSGATGYEVCRDGLVIAHAPQNGFLNDGLTPGVRYRYTVFATNEAGRSAESEAVSAAIPLSVSGPEVSVTDSSEDAHDLLVDIPATRLGHRSNAEWIYVRNSGDQLLVVSNIVISGEGACDFQLIIKNAEGERVEEGTISIEPNETYSLELRFMPTVAGERRANVSFATNDTDDGEEAVQVNLEAVAIGTGPEVRVGDDSGETWDQLVCFSDTVLGDATVPLTFFLENLGDEPLQVANLRRTGPHAGDFEFTLRDENGNPVEGDNPTIAAGSIYHIEVVFAPSSEGIRSANIVFETNDPDGNEDDVALVVTGFGRSHPNAIGLSTTCLSVVCTQGQDGVSQQLDVWNGGDGAMAYTVGANETWLSLDPTAGDSTGEHDPISVNFATAGLEEGLRTAAIMVTAPGATNSPRTVAVRLDVRPRPAALAVSVSSLSILSTQGQDAASRQFEVWNAGGGSMAYSLAADKTWLSLGATNGSSAGEHDTIRADFPTAGLDTGLFNATITVTAPGATNTSRVIAVQLEVLPPPATLVLSHTSIAFVCTQGQGVVSRAFEVANTGNGSMAYTLTPNQPWLSLVPPSGESSGEHDPIELRCDPTGMQTGSYPATITVSAPRATNSPQTIAVSLSVVPPPPVIGLSTNSLAPVCATSNDAPADVIEIRNIGGGILSYALSEDATWLSLDPLSGDCTTEADSIIVTYPSAGLSNGQYFATITVTAPDATNTPQTIPVTLTVQSPDRIIRLEGDLDFGSVMVGSNAVAILAIHNDGSNALSIAGITNAPGFSGDCVTQVMAGGSVDLPITFAPSLVGPYSGVLKVVSDATSGTDTMPEMGVGVALAGSSSNRLINGGFEGPGGTNGSTKVSWGGSGVATSASTLDLDSDGQPDGILAAEGQSVVKMDWDASTNTWQNALQTNLVIRADDVGRFWTARVMAYLPSTDPPTNSPPNAEPRLRIEVCNPSGINVSTYFAPVDPARLDEWQELTLFGAFSSLDVGGTYKFVVQGGVAWSGSTLFDDASFTVGQLGSAQVKWSGAGASAAWVDPANWESNAVAVSSDDSYVGTGFASGTNLSLAGTRSAYSLTLDPGAEARAMQIGQTVGAETLQIASGRLTRVRSASTNLFAIYPNLDFGTPPGGRAILDNGHFGGQPSGSPNSQTRILGQITAAGDVLFLSRQSTLSGDSAVWQLRGEGKWTGKTVLGEDSIGAQLIMFHPRAIPPASPIEVRNCAYISKLHFYGVSNVFPNAVDFGAPSPVSSPQFRIIAEGQSAVTVAGRIRSVDRPFPFLALWAGAGSTLRLSNPSNDLSGINYLFAGWWNSESGDIVLMHKDVVRGAPEVQVVARGTSWLLGDSFVFAQPFRIGASGLTNALTAIRLGGIHASGTAEFSGPQFWTNATANGATLRLHSENAGAVTRFSGDITDGLHSINIEKTGAGEVVLAGSNSWSGPTTLKAGRLTLESDGALSPESALVFAGGELALHGRSATLASLMVGGAGGGIDFGPDLGGNDLVFASGVAGTWAGTLSVTNFDPATDRMRFGTSASGVGGNETRIRFVNPVGRPGTYAGRVDENGYVLLGDRTIEFAGMEWVASSGVAEPGGNQWADGAESAWVDEAGLHLKICNIGGTWRCAGVRSVGTTKEGIHRFWLSSRVDQLDPNIVATLGLRKDDGSKSMDMDFSRWGNASGPNVRYAVQPGPLVEGTNLRSRTLDLLMPQSTHYIDWAGGGARFKSFRGHSGDISGPDESAYLDDWTCTAAAVPTGGDDLHICIQLWLAGGVAPSDGQEAELIVRAAEFPPGVAALGQKDNVLINPSFEDTVPPSKAPWSNGGVSAVASNLNLDGDGLADGITARHGTNVLWIDHDGATDSFYQYYWFKPEDVGKGWRAALASQIPSTDPPTNAWTLGHQPRVNIAWTEPNWTSVITGYAYCDPAQTGVWQTVELNGVVAAADVGRRLEFKGYAVGSTYTGSALYDDAHFDLGSAFGQSTRTWTPSAGSGAWADAARWSSGRVPGILDDAVVAAGPEPQTSVSLDGEQIMYSLTVDNSGMTGAVSVGSAPHAGKLHVISGRVITPISSNESPFAINADIDFGRPQGGEAVFDAWRVGVGSAAKNIELRIYGDIGGECDVKFLVTQNHPKDVLWRLCGTGRWFGKTVLGDVANASRLIVASPTAIPPSSTIECAGQRYVSLTFATNVTLPNDIVVPCGCSESASRSIAIRAGEKSTVELAGQITTKGSLSQGWLALISTDPSSTLILSNDGNRFDGLGRVITGAGGSGGGRIVLAKAGVFREAPDIYFQARGGAWVLQSAFELPQAFYVAPNGLSNSLTRIVLGGIHASGTAEFSGAQYWTNATADGATLQLHCENAGAVTRFSGDITDGDVSINVQKTGAGEVVLAGSNSWSGLTTISNGVLTLASADAMPPVSPLAVGAGMLHLAGLDVTVASLDVISDSASLDFGSGAGANAFVAISGAVGAWSGKLVIRHFEPTTDTIRLGTSDADAQGNDARITFVDPAGMATGSYAAVVQADGYVTVGPRINLYESWAAGRGLSGAAASFEYDAEGDGVPNGAEFAFNMDPRARDPNRLPLPIYAGGNLTVTFTEPPEVGGITYGAEVSTNLLDWVPVTDSGSNTTHTFAFPVGESDKLFMRLKVSSP